jgi:hypothetical protein
MFANEFEFCPCVVECLCDGRKRFRVVTIFAIRSDCIIVFVLMATYARLGKAEISFLPALVYDIKDFCIFEIFLRVAVFAICRSVFARTNEPRYVVVECFLVE